MTGNRNAGTTPVRRNCARLARPAWPPEAARRAAGGTTWTSGKTATNHYSDDTDSPAWTADSSGTITRSVTDMTGALGATTSASGAITLQFANLHGDIAVTLATATTTTTAYSYDEYGNTTNTSRYGWQGNALRASDTPTGSTLMGLRLYNPTTGRFLQTDPVQNGSATAHDYCNGDPVNCSDLNGQCPSFLRHPVKSSLCTAALVAVQAVIDVLGDALCVAAATALAIVGGVIVNGVGAAVGYYVEARWNGHFSYS
ncbi:RHS repeat-associated core domain-containing protein [Streptomyces sp. W16]|uniref:RHS repeat-associated core domain-containing protein n=1 Tax=Streptomyces sp. W16 TaxID=3076631 RepID=UPI00295B9BD2|nr:RHS repeat-associated core domain-containing protein [Streptomyces sp. W16]MDV9173094.1 RHS repeat-associated core domain-containing protein [Streptomyces sp. W16]